MNINEVENFRLHDVDWKKIGYKYTSNSKKSSINVKAANDIPLSMYKSNSHKHKIVRSLYE